MTLQDQNCVPCQGGIPALSRQEAERYLVDLPKWTLEGGATRIRRRYTFADFVGALAFVNRVGDVAEAQGHHPDISFGWGYAEVVIFTHKIAGLHENDFILAARVEQLFEGG